MEKLFLKNTGIIVLLSLIVVLISVFLPNIILKGIGHMSIDDHTSLAIVGNSRPECAFDDSKIKNTKNLSNSGESYFYNYTKLKKIIEDNPNLKTVLIEFSFADIGSRNDEWIWGFEKMSLFYPNYSPFFDPEDVRFLYQQNEEDFWAVISIATRENLSRLLTFRFSYLDVIGGYERLEESLKELPETEKKIEDSPSTPRVYQLSNDNLLYLKKMVDLCKTRNIQVIFLRCPTHPSTFNIENESLFTSIKNKQFGNIEFLDFSNFPLTNQDFADKTHLNSRGAEKLSIWLDHLLQNDLLSKADKAQYIQHELQRLKKNS